MLAEGKPQPRWRSGLKPEVDAGVLRVRGQRAQAACLDVLHHFTDDVEGHRDLPAQQVLQQRPAPAVGDALERHARGAFEHHPGKGAS